jgi:hypothetical protein
MPSLVTIKPSIRNVLGEEDRVDGSVVYLAEGSQLRYLSAGASRELGWR